MVNCSQRFGLVSVESGSNRFRSTLVQCSDSIMDTNDVVTIADAAKTVEVELMCK